MMANEKIVHTVVLDAGPIIRGEPGVSSLLHQAERIVSTPAVIGEIRDEATRTRLDTTLLPFLVLKSPNQESTKIITDFARKTGDLSVLSRVDIQLLALAYELECERNGGDWRLRKTPGQKRTNGPPPPKEAVEHDLASPQLEESSMDERQKQPSETPLSDSAQRQNVEGATNINLPFTSPHACQEMPPTSITPEEGKSSETIRDSSEQNLDLSTNSKDTVVSVDDVSQSLDDAQISESGERNSSEDSDSEGWITPSNLKKKQTEDAVGDAGAETEAKMMQVATITTDFAMQNVLLQMNLNLMSPQLRRVKHIKTFVLRCHACFNVVKDMTKQFCPRCGRPTLTRVSCSTNANGEFKMHFKKNMQWNTRGDRFSVPKPVAGAANGRVQGGGKGGWGSKLILAEDQKEYARAISQEKKQKHRDLMDEDYLPSILTGDRATSGGRPKVGAGRNVNSRKR